MFKFSGQPQSQSQPQLQQKEENTKPQSNTKGWLAGTPVHFLPPVPATPTVSGAVESASGSPTTSTAPPSFFSEPLQETFSTHPTQPDSLTQEQVTQFKSLFGQLEKAMGNPVVVGQVLRRIMVDLAETPQYSEFLLPADGGLMVKACRESYGAAVVTKKARATGRRKKNDFSDEVSAAMGGLADKLKEMNFT